MKRVDKFLKKCSEKEKEQIIDVLEKIVRGELENLDIKKLKGYQNYFRIRKGSIRIIFHLDQKNNPIIESIERRSDTTYNI